MTETRLHDSQQGHPGRISGRCQSTSGTSFRGLWWCWLGLCLLALGCGREPSKQNSPLVLQLNWIPDAQHGGFYAASSDGHFAAEGLDIQIVPGGPNSSPVIQKLTMGRCDFAVANADQVLLARQQGADLVAVFAAMQDSPRCIMVHESTGISSLQDLGKVSTLALGDGKPFAEFLKRHVNLDGVRLVSYSGTVAKFLTDESYAQQAYLFSEPLVVRSRGEEPRSLLVSEIGFNPYSSILVTRRETWDADPALVRRVVRAVTAGWQSYLDEPQSANALILVENPEMSPELLADAVPLIRSLCRPGRLQGPLGTMQSDRWEQLRQQLVELELLKIDSPAASTAWVKVD